MNPARIDHSTVCLVGVGECVKVYSLVVLARRVGIKLGESGLILGFFVFESNVISSCKLISKSPSFHGTKYGASLIWNLLLKVAPRWSICTM